MRRLLLLAASLVATFAIAGTAAAETPPILQLDLQHNQTNFPPGGVGEYWAVVHNVGDTNTSGPITLHVELPEGLTRATVRKSGDFPETFWDCPGAEGDTEFTCTSTSTIRRHWDSYGLELSVNVAADAPPELTTTATVEGGGAAAPAATVERTQIDSAPAGFGISAPSFLGEFWEDEVATPVRQAGAHPAKTEVRFDFNSVDAPNPTRWPAVPWQKAPAGNVRHLQVDMPVGFMGNPTAVEECTPAQLTEGQCPLGSQVGRMDVTIMPTQVLPNVQMNKVHPAVFNMAHPRGAISDLAFIVFGNQVHIRVSLDPANHYGIRTTVPDINESFPVFAQKLTLWGIPSDPSHDWERCAPFGNINPFVFQSCPSPAPRKAYLTTPTDCSATGQVVVNRYDSWQHPGVFGEPITYTQPGPPTGCEKLRIEPDVVVHPTNDKANSPTGLSVHVEVPQIENANGLATPPLKSMKVTMPEGMTVSPSFATGLTGCSSVQIALGTEQGADCPDSSRIGTVTMDSPVLPNPLEGSMYLAAQGDNPFGSTFAMYLVVHDSEERGILVKMPGRLDLDPQTGQVTTTFDDLPQLPANDFALNFRSGSRAPLINPPTCGTQTIAVEVASWAQPLRFLDRSNHYEVSEGPNGTQCPNGLGGRGLAPQFRAGVTNPTAGSFTDFVFRVQRDDSDQDLSRIETTLPKGLLAKIAGVSGCPEAAIASISEAEGSAAKEAAAPSCPASSEIGRTEVSMGAGAVPKYFDGKVYLAGPYKGAPLSLVVVVPALAGPYDLGTVAVRAAIQVDPETARVHVVSDPLPSILHGVLLRVRDVRVSMDRAESMINPTSCDPTSVAARILGLSGAAVDLLDRFQLTSCASLGFKPKLALKLKGGTHRGDYPALTATLTARKGDANIGRAAVTLPHSEFLEQAHIGTVCTRVQYAAKACPAGSIYGYAKATSPLLGEPLEGPVYLRSSNNPLPDLVASLDGRVHLDLVGRIDAIHGGIRTTFSSVPDAPVTKFTLKMKGGKKSLLVNSRNLCDRSARAQVKLGAHNGRVSRSNPLLKTGCRRARR